MTETQISRSVRRIFAGGGALGLALLFIPPLAQAQAQGAAPAPPVQRVEITGSNIRRAQAETASSVLTVNRADIERSGKTTVAELLQTLAVDNAGSVPVSFSSGFASGASGISLRGLGVASTLVLLNGRRMAPYALADDSQKVFADLNVIPTDAVDRVEILKDGASAVYGSDAVAGVVNIILRRNYNGTTARYMLGTGTGWEGQQDNFALTHGFGDLETDRFNVLLNFEYRKHDELFYRDRGNRDWVGKIDLRQWGYSAQQALGGTGAIVDNNLAGAAINGNVRNPVTLDYYNRGNPNGVGFTRQFPAAACSNFTSHPQGDPLGGCLIDAPLVYEQILPTQENLSLFGRGTWRLTDDIEAYAEGNWYKSMTDSSDSPASVSSSVGYPGGPVSNAGVALGAAHPDNPYFGTAARLRYLAGDVGPRQSAVDSTFVRAVAGLKGTHFGWDWDGALLYSRSKVDHEYKNYLQRDAAFALLNPTLDNVTTAILNNPGYAALPPGTLWRIAENAGLNSPEMYAALAPRLSNPAKSEIALVDVKGSREYGKLAGGALGVALGGEFRRERSELEPAPGTERGNIIGLAYSAFEGARNIGALYAEVLAPVLPNLEVTAALRWDYYTDVGDAWNPKVGAKWNPVREVALRATWARAFRAPSAAENGAGGLSAFSTATDPLRCALGVASACDPASIAVITASNPDLSPERAKIWNVGVIWDPLPRASVSLDYWEIKRTDEINQEQIDAAIAAGHVARDPSTATSIPGDPGAITVVLANYVNSAETKVRGLDVDARYRHTLPGGWGNAILDAKWTHLFEWERTERDGSVRDYAGTHGNCDVTNCMGTPADRVNLSLGWERDAWRVNANVNYRGVLENRFFKDDPEGCASHFANGQDAPGGCELASFTTLDLVFRWKAMPRLEVFGSVQNVFDKIPPLDPLTYGAQSYNPLDTAGAIGRFFTLGARYTF